MSFQARDDNARLETMERIRANGVIPPILVRPCGLEGDEAILSGHRRKPACAWKHANIRAPEAISLVPESGTS